MADKYSPVTDAVSKKFTSDTAQQFGALKGANCKVKSVTDITDGNNNVVGKKTTYEYKNDSNVIQTADMDIMYSDIANMVLAQLPTAEGLEV